MGFKLGWKLVLTNEIWPSSCFDFSYEAIDASVGETDIGVYFIVASSGDKNVTSILTILIPSTWATVTKGLF